MSVEGAGDGSDIFWPGYVDAVTNLVLNLLFMLTIMIVAVFMFALQLSRAKTNNPTPAVEIPIVNPAAEIVSKDGEIQALRKALESLKSQALVQNELRGAQKVVTAKSAVPQPDKDLEKLTATGGGVIVSFGQDAVTLSAPEAQTLRTSLASIAASGSARIVVLVPAGFSEAKRLGFYRAMAVRNQLIEMKLASDKIEVSIREGKSSADNAKVLVSPR
ncbi:MAG: hypothetical protein WCH44_03975 [Betaproteobacteria bacterium]